MPILQLNLVGRRGAYHANLDGQFADVGANVGLQFLKSRLAQLPGLGFVVGFDKNVEGSGGDVEGGHGLVLSIDGDGHDPPVAVGHVVLDEVGELEPGGGDAVGLGLGHHEVPTIEKNGLAAGGLSVLERFERAGELDCFEGDLGHGRLLGGLGVLGDKEFARVPDLAAVPRLDRVGPGIDAVTSEGADPHDVARLAVERGNHFRSGFQALIGSIRRHVLSPLIVGFPLPAMNIRTVTSFGAGNPARIR
jgi:hypothetical protein